MRRKPLQIAGLKSSLAQQHWNKVKCWPQVSNVLPNRRRFQHRKWTYLKLLFICWHFSIGCFLVQAKKWLFHLIEMCSKIEWNQWDSVFLVLALWMPFITDVTMGGQRNQPWSLREEWRERLGWFRARNYLGCVWWQEMARWRSQLSCLSNCKQTERLGFKCLMRTSAILCACCTQLYP